MIGSDIELMPDEKMVLASNPHWFFFWKEVAGAAGVIGLLLLLAWANIDWINTVLGWATAIALLVLVIDIILRFVQWKSTKFAITDQRVAYQSGVFRRRGVSIPLNRVNNVNFQQSIIARVLNNGVVVIESAGETGDSVFENIPDPQKVRTLIFAGVETDEQRDSDRDAESLAKAIREQKGLPTPSTPAAAPSPTVPERLAQLEALLAQRVVTDDEYALKRRQILEDL